MPLPMARCANCGTPVANPRARFCGHCGAELASLPPPPVADHRAALVVMAPEGDRVWPILGHRASIGREQSNDIVIDDRMVSRHHAVIEAGAEGWVLRDLQSRNGLSIDGRKVAAATLRGGEQIHIGDGLGHGIRLRFRGPTGGEAADGPSPEDEHRPRTIPLKPGTGGLVIGRDPAADVVLDHPLVSRRHAQLVQTPSGGHEVVDLGSTNHTLVAGQRVTRRHLTIGDVIEIGPFRLRYEGAGLTQDPRADGGGFRIDAVGVCKDVRKGRGWTRLLTDVDLTVLPNEFIALVGGSGAGKSTLLKALNGLRPATHGRILVNGIDFYKAFDRFRAFVGYVPQADIIHRNLPVEQALRYAAALRLPPDTGVKEREQRIDTVLRRVNMEASRNLIVHTLSGGQLKRICTAMELLAEPKLLFLDEPTSGLDPGLDKRMMHLFRQLADAGQTVVIVTHATANIERCDHVAFLAPGGHLVFFGPPHQALRFFGKSDFADIYTEVEADPIGWSQRFRRAPEYQQYVVARQFRSTARDGASGMPQARRGSGQLRQLRIVTARYVELIRRDVRNLALLLLQAPIIGVLLYSVVSAQTRFKDVPTLPLGTVVAVKRSQSILTNAQTVLFFMALVAVWFGVINAAREINKELPIFERERLADLGIGPYLGSKLAVMSGLCVLQAAALLAIVLGRTGPPATGLVFGPAADLYITLFLTAEAGMAAGLVLSSMVANQDRAMSIVPLVLMPQFLFAGVSFALDSDVKLALGRLSLTYWSTHALGSIVNLCGSFKNAVCDQDFFRLGYEATAGAVLTDWLALAGWMAVYVLIAALYLKRKDTV